jgi:hypothetical protein
MAEILDLLFELSPSLKVEWILWLTSGLALAAWFGLARRAELQPTTSASLGHSMSILTTTASLSEAADQPAASASASAPSSEAAFRPGRSSRSFRRPSTRAQGVPSTGEGHKS